jgi:ribosomal protein S18 acetylase RimI-like enzyme
LALEVALLPPEAADDAALVADLCDRINAAYGEAEAALWKAGTGRIAFDRVAEIVAAGELAVARVDGRIVGSVRVRMLDERTGFFGLLTVHPDDQGIGAGRELIRFAEGLAGARGAAEMELRLLVPRDGTDVHKERLDGWYSRLGYRIAGRSDFAAQNPAAAASMRRPLELVTYRKVL